MNYLKAAIDAPLRRTFDYLPAEGRSVSDYPVGSRVLVPFGKREVIGIVVDWTASSSVDASMLKRAGEPTDDLPLLDDQLLRFMSWVSNYYHHPLGTTIFTLLPSYFCKAADAEPYLEQAAAISIKGKGLPEGALSGAPKQQELLNTLREASGAISFSTLNKHYKNTAGKGS